MRTQAVDPLVTEYETAPEPEPPVVESATVVVPEALTTKGVWATKAHKNVTEVDALTGL